MAVIPRLLFVLMLIVGPVIVWTTSAGLPARVATHFGRGGFANGWMSHDGYIAFMLLMTVLVPLVVVAATGLIPRFATSRISLPYRQYWLTPERRENTLGWLASHGCSLGILLILFLTGMHFLVIEANTRSPPRLDEQEFIVVLVGFMVLLVVWIVAIALRFRKLR